MPPIYGLVMSATVDKVQVKFVHIKVKFGLASSQPDPILK